MHINIIRKYLFTKDCRQKLDYKIRGSQIHGSKMEFEENLFDDCNIKFQDDIA